MQVRQTVEQIQTPVVAAHKVTRWEFEIDFSLQRESHLAANGVRGDIIHRRKGMDEQMFPRGAGRSTIFNLIPRFYDPFPTVAHYELIQTYPAMLD